MLLEQWVLEMNFIWSIKLFKKQVLVFMILKKKPFEYIVEKAENTGNQHFLLFPQFYPIKDETFE